ncbi:chromosome partitioning protein ParB [Vibrio sp. UCD-FRSSP16_10]|uniref:cytochrome C assembly family protein n=1 Tax=unclassified Vibrio TaxID=2614977 RepID=UPI0007FC221B|nr:MULTISPECIES: inner membrane protein YpjD [unclassified Vibrio]OBT17312.1 chromosome partitioning protein ParB [Vibrio sp. UCD-FRSSP16_30]OBT23081.1 chromosome partitioning protein ParB [Vibrio sp. UCD-FRSSP16_10]
MDFAVIILAVLLYLSAIFLILPGLLRQSEINRKTVLSITFIALILHFSTLFESIFISYGQNMSILNVASLVSFIISLVLSIAMFKARLWFLLPIAFGFSCLSLIAAEFIPGNFITHFEHSPGLVIHITVALFAYATLMIAALYALQLAWLDYKLKQKNSQVLNPNLPPLLKVERQLFNIILIGNGLLTFTLISGPLFVVDFFSSGKTHKALLSFVAWLVFNVLLWGHYKLGWRGKKVTWFSIIGACILTLAYFGSRFVREIILT